MFLNSHYLSSLETIYMMVEEVVNIQDTKKEVDEHISIINALLLDIDTIHFLSDNIKEHNTLDKQSYNLIANDINNLFYYHKVNSTNLTSSLEEVSESMFEKIKIHVKKAFEAFIAFCKKIVDYIAKKITNFKNRLKSFLFKAKKEDIEKIVENKVDTEINEHPGLSNSNKKELDDAIKNNDFSMIKSIIKEIGRKNLVEAKEAFDYVKFVPNLLEAYNNKLELKEAIEWDKDYFYHISSDLSMNFSEKLFEHYLKVGAKVFPEKWKKQTHLYSNIQANRSKSETQEVEVITKDELYEFIKSKDIVKEYLSGNVSKEDLAKVNEPEPKTFKSLREAGYDANWVMNTLPKLYDEVEKERKEVSGIKTQIQREFDTLNRKLQNKFAHQDRAMVMLLRNHEKNLQFATMHLQYLNNILTEINRVTNNVTKYGVLLYS